MSFFNKANDIALVNIIK